MRAVLDRLHELRAERGGYSSAAEPAAPPTTVRARLGELWSEHRRGASRSTVAAAASVVAHALVLVVLAQLTFPEYGQRLITELQAWIDDPAEPEPAELPTLFDMADPSDDPAQTVFKIAANALAPATAPASEPRVIENFEPADLETPHVVPVEVQELSPLEISQQVVRTGTIGDEVLDVQGAVDRITHEIVTNLAEHEVLVIWLMDASISLLDERQQVAKRLERVFSEIDQLGGFPPGRLTNAVASFGADVQHLVKPTADPTDVLAAIRELPVDDSGVESVFAAVLSTLDRYRTQHTRHDRQLMLVVWTDESGDDYALLEDAVRGCQKLAAPVYAVGPSAMFGREKGFHAYRHPETGRVYPIEVDRGPDAVRFELLNVPYWFEGERHEQLRSGIGPFALTRLALATGGAYFVSEEPADRSPFQLAAVKRYLPDYGSAAEYSKLVAESRLRQAVLRAVDITHERKLKGTPRLEFEPTGENFQQQLREAQQSVAFNLMTIEQALAPFAPAGMEKEYAQELSPRWLAWYDLTLGRLLAMQVRCNEYNWACAVMKGKGADFVNRQSNRWKFQPSAQLNFGSAAEKQAAEARRLLERCVERNPGTPWAALAQRELAHPFGFEVQEGYVPPPPEPPPMNGLNNPPPQGIRVDQLRRLPREAEPVLPKL
ncbi:MAG: VWA domain-containing protein, partial [Planctomycetaceae bacterium]|nr:VWA domain-containing protein [Planctomycetaceae bacterium]